jgi:hypothetical protein
MSAISRPRVGLNEFRTLLTAVLVRSLIVAVVGCGFGLMGTSVAGARASHRSILANGTPHGEGFLCTSTTSNKRSFMMWSRAPSGAVIGKIYIPSVVEHFKGRQTNKKLVVTIPGTLTKVVGVLTGSSLTFTMPGTEHVKKCKLVSVNAWKAYTLGSSP